MIRQFILATAFTTTCVIGFSGLSIAQSAPDQQLQMFQGLENMSLEQIEALTTQMEKSLGESTQCMANIDQGQLNTLKQQGLAIQQRIDSLCKEGKQAEAQNYALAESRKFATDPTVVQIQKCTENMGDDFAFFRHSGQTDQLPPVCR